MYHDGNCCIKHIETAYTQRIHPPCDHGYSFSSHREDAIHFDQSTDYAGAEYATQITKYKWIHH